MPHRNLFLTVLAGVLFMPALAARAQGGGGGGVDPAQAQRMFQQFMQNGTVDPQLQQLVQQFMSQAQQRAVDTIHEQFRCTDEEWEALEPQVQRLLKAQINTAVSGGGMFGGMMGMMGNRGGLGSISALFPDQSKELQQAQRELQAALANPEVSAKEVMDKLDAFRAARKQVADALREVQTDLKKQLNMRQEAVLVSLGLME
jgi:hypothetical protein